MNKRNFKGSLCESHFLWSLGNYRNWQCTRDLSKQSYQRAASFDDVSAVYIYAVKFWPYELIL